MWQQSGGYQCPPISLFSVSPFSWLGALSDIISSGTKAAQTVEQRVYAQ
jgi:hypothetical protein